MTDANRVAAGRAWAEAFLAAVQAEGERRRTTGEGSCPGHRTRFAGLVSAKLVCEGDRVVLEAAAYPPVQDEEALLDGTWGTVVPITSDGWRTTPVGGLTQFSPEVAARVMFENLEIEIGD